MTTVRLPTFGFSLHRADYYGWTFAAHVGPFLIFFWRTHDPAACDWCGYRVKNPCKSKADRQNCENA
jgi:hypothetical protein